MSVVDPDAADDPNDPRRVRARAMLLERATWFGPDTHAGRVTVEVVAGQPARALGAVAATVGAVVVVLGHRGTGLDRHLLGEVAAGLTRRAAVPVLLADSPDAPLDGDPGSDARGTVVTRLSV